MTAQRHIVIAGAGSIGCYIGGCLLRQADRPRVTFVGRDRIKQDLLQHGLHISAFDKQSMHIPYSQFHFTEELDPCRDADILLLCVKSMDTAVLAQQLVPVLSEHTAVVSLQNGVRNPEVLQEVLPNNEIIGGIVPFNVINKSAGHYHQSTSGLLALQQSRSSKELCSLFGRGGLACQAVKDLNRLQWTKLLMNLNNAVNALCGIPLVDELNNRRYRWIIAQSIEEALNIFKKANIKPKVYGTIVPALLPTILRLPDALFTVVAKKLIAIDSDARSSMYDDLQRQRRTEIDFIQGEILKLAQVVNVPAPYNRAIFNLIKHAEKQAQGSPQLDATALESLMPTIN